jgi:hypothetical protein
MVVGRVRVSFLVRVGVGLALGAILLAGAAAARAASARSEHPGQRGTVKPHAYGSLDCNGFSPIQKPIKKTMLCTDPRDPTAADHRFDENGHYIGHDEPDLNFSSSAHGSGNDNTWTFTLPVDPAADPTTGHPGSDVSHTFELTPAMWLSMNICDPQSYPLNACTPNSDSNAPRPEFLGGGSAFMELQFYPPGFAPFVDATSVDNTHWAAALNIDSLEANKQFELRNDCVEPVNFAYIQRDGVPPGPPSPQLTDLRTFTPNSETLLMNPGDRIRAHIFDAPLPGGHGKALETFVEDLTTGQSGVMQASADNGFMNTSIVNCAGIPFNFEPAYDTAKPGNVSPWGAGTEVISTSVETGHFTPCTTLTDPVLQQLSDGRADPAFASCHGAYEETVADGDGPNSPEGGDGPCYLQGDTHGGLAEGSPNLTTGCFDFFGQGDVDFDGTPYWTEWPTGTTPTNVPSALVYRTPTFGSSQQQFAAFQFQTDLGFFETATCRPDNQQGCTVPAPNAPGGFYPYWTQVDNCTFEFGNVSTGNTFGKFAQYGGPNPNLFPDFTSEFHPNPCRS